MLRADEQHDLPGCVCGNNLGGSFRGDLDGATHGADLGAMPAAWRTRTRP
ncbi:MAG: hypothetical protein U0575_10605 [Phycisphaerales bacterium]